MNWKPRNRWGRRLAIVACATALVSGVFVPAALAAPGDVTYAGCVGELPVCAPTVPESMWHADDIAVDGLNLYVAAGTALSHYTIGSGGAPRFIGCYGENTGCQLTLPFQGFAHGIAVSPDGTRLFVTHSDVTGQDGAVSEFSIDSAGNLRFLACVGNVPGCRAVNPSDALDFADGVVVSPGDKQIYVTKNGSWGGVVHLTIEDTGYLAFAGCYGRELGCTAVSAARAIDDDTTGVAVSPDGRDLYVLNSYEGALSDFLIDSAGNLSLADCTGAVGGCVPNTNLVGASHLAISADDKHLYVTATESNTVSHYLLSSGTPVYRTCLGPEPGCTPTTQPGAFDNVTGLAISPNGGDLYAVSTYSGAPPYGGKDGTIMHFTFNPSGDPVFANCLSGYISGCASSGPGLAAVDTVAVSGDGAYLFIPSYYASYISYYTIAGFL
jgi:DNA-binding beta-propeller fold protein YncE